MRINGFDNTDLACEMLTDLVGKDSSVKLVSHNSQYGRLVIVTKTYPDGKKVEWYIQPTEYCEKLL